MPRSGNSVIHKTIKMGNFTQEVEFYLHWNHTSNGDYRELIMTTYKNLSTEKNLTAEEWDPLNMPSTEIEKEAKIDNIGEVGITNLLHIENTSNSSDNMDNLYFKTLLLNCDLNSILYELAANNDIVTEDIFQSAMLNANFTYLGRALELGAFDRDLFYGKLVSQVIAKGKDTSNMDDSMDLYVVYTLGRGSNSNNSYWAYRRHDLKEYLIIKIRGTNPKNIILAEYKKYADVECTFLKEEIENLNNCLNQDIVKHIITREDYYNLTDLMSNDYISLHHSDGLDISDKQTENYISSYNNLLYLMSRIKFYSLSGEGPNSMNDCKSCVNDYIKNVVDPQ